jgi:hypothetical protein
MRGENSVRKYLVELGHIPPPDPEAPGAFVMADPEHIRKLVVGTGFAEPEIEEVSFRWRFANQDAYWRFLTETAASVSPVLRTLPLEAQDTVREQCTKRRGRSTPTRDTTSRPCA